MNFKEAYELPIGKDVEKKGRFSYLSWTYAVKHLRENFPGATWVIKEDDKGSPIFPAPEGWMVNVTVIVDGCRFPQWHPILDHKNNPIKEPNSFEINTSLQRCLTKAIGLATGIGLALYAGEDLPTEPPAPKLTKADFQAKVDVLDSSEAIDSWIQCHMGKAKGALSKADFEWFENYIVQIKEVFNT
jgi:hypothetical protein